MPIDDTCHWRYEFHFHSKVPLDKEGYARAMAREIGPDGHYYRNRENRYQQDREQMKEHTFAGLGMYFPTHDTFVIESQGAVEDRTLENLSTTLHGPFGARGRGPGFSCQGRHSPSRATPRDRLPGAGRRVAGGGPRPRQAARS